MDGKNRAASSYLSPGNPPADKEQNDPLAQVFHNACSYNFFAMAELLHRLAKGEKGTPELSLRDDPAQETLRFSADASLAFPCSDISALKRDTSGAFRMTTTFMGLQGTVSGRPISMTQNCCNLPPLCWPWRQTCRSIRSSVSLSSSRKFPRRKKSAIWSVCRSPVFHCVPLWWLPASFLIIPGSAISNSTRADRPGQKWLPPGPLHCMYPAVSRI